MKTIETATNDRYENGQANHRELLDSLRCAAKKIAPLWSLENFVAVNPYLGLTNKSFHDVAHELSVLGGIESTLPTAYYLKKWLEDEITVSDLEQALTKFNIQKDPEDFILEVEPDLSVQQNTKTLWTVSDFASDITGQDWNRFFLARISHWASSYFDNGQAKWSTARKNDGLYLSWKTDATIDRTTDIAGLKGFRSKVKELPESPLLAVQLMLEKLGVSADEAPNYFHRLLIRCGGWAAYSARIDWESELYGGEGGVLIELLAVLVCWEACLLDCIKNPELEVQWRKAKGLLGTIIADQFLNEELAQKLILQEAFDISAQRRMISQLNKQAQKEKVIDKSVTAQAIFCIDVRSEVYRRHLETANKGIETFGFAGFFAFAINYIAIGNEKGEAQCPVLLQTGPNILEENQSQKEAKKVYDKRLANRQLRKVWKSFKSGAITCFSFVSPLGLYYLPKLISDSFGLTRPVQHPDTVGFSKKALKSKKVSLQVTKVNGMQTGIPLNEQIAMAKNALGAMSLTDNFAEFVLIVGHGSTTVNNPHATGYDCGACGGHTGESNARVAAEVLNNKEVRAGLQKEDIFIPVKTVFLACLHDTTTDELTIYNEYDVAQDQKAAFMELKQSLINAGKSAREERSLRFRSGDKSDKAIMQRSKDWAQVRPEWGLAGCSTFVVAPRERTKGIDFQGKSFLHSYNWESDKNFSILELIMTAPMVVTSWINLQYYGSTVDNKNYGSGNKTLHNVTAGLGVLEGYSGDIRVGLPMQAIHDGKDFQHEPLKLKVIIEAPIDEMNKILEKHEAVRNLCDNGWIYLHAMDENGKVSHTYKGGLNWLAINENLN